jgi:alpha,alpha-trehalase
MSTSRSTRATDAPPTRTGPSAVRDLRRFRAAVFDLDGVVTFTARLHMATWKELFDDYLRSRASRFGEPFRPFTEADYRTWVDGRPRFDGVRTFLASRGIALPEGTAEDAEGAETVMGLGNRKNLLFRSRLENSGVEVDGKAVALIQALRACGVRVGVASSSKNTESILEAAGLGDLFEARVDGVVSERLGLSGKPAPDIFLECLRRLGVADPACALVAEDAEAGVEAGRAGGFGLVLGVDRGGRAILLREHGADWVIHDLEEAPPEKIESYFENREHARPNAIARWSELSARLEGSTPAVFLDYDGTLTPIVARPDLAVLGEEMREALRRLTEAWPTTIVSGRGREDVAALVGLEEVNYAGSHGFDIAGPDAGTVLEVRPELVPVLSDAAGELRRRTEGIPGVIVENKRFSVAVHYRLVDERRVPEVEAHVDDLLTGQPELRKAHGKKVFEIRPAMEWDKGRAVLWLLEALGLHRAGVVPLYVGDDVTDEDAFRALEGRGLGILVAEIPRPTAAAYSLQDVGEVLELLRRLAEWKGSGRS